MKGFGKGVWVGEKAFENPDTIREMVDRLRDAGFDLLVPLVKSYAGYLDWRTRIGKPNPAFANCDVMETLSRECRRVGLKIHPWFCVAREGEGSALLEQGDTCACKDEHGKVLQQPAQGTWVCALQPAVHEYERGLMVEVMDNYDVDGVHLDYIRIGHVCFCSHCRNTVRQWTDLPLERVSLDAATDARAAEAYGKWMDWRRSRVTELVRQVRQDAAARKKAVSAAVFRNLQYAFEGQAQDWALWGREGLVDYLFPMNYTPSVAAAREATRLHVAAVRGGCAVWEGLGKRSSLSYLPTTLLMEQVRGVLEEGAAGIVIFSYSGIEESDWQALAAL